MQLTKVITTSLKVDGTRNTRLRGIRVKLGGLGIFQEDLVIEVKLRILFHRQFLYAFKSTNVHSHEQ